MPHLVIQHSANLNGTSGMKRLCAALRDALSASGIFPVGGIRVRAEPVSSYVIADDHPDNAFVDMVLRIGAGRTAAEKTATGKALMAAAEHHFSERLKSPHFALSLEIVEISPEFSWRTNTIHPRLAASAKLKS